MGSLKPDGIDTYPADAHDLDSFRQAEAAPIRLPVLVHADNPHERLYVAALDGTGNNKFKDVPKNWSVVARISDQILALNDTGIHTIASGYVKGIGTQDSFLARTVDSVNGYTFEQRVETGYYQFCEQSYAWLKEDPHAQIRMAGIGFSRGAEEIAALQRMIDERGIRNPEGANLTRNKDGLITHIQYADKPLLREPGQTVQVALLYDPVSTGVQEYDRRRPPSVVAGVQITAEDERRDQFKSTTHIAPGCSGDGRFCNLTVGGSHSDIGNTYSKNGLGARSFNLGVDVLNAFSDRPFLRKQTVPDDPTLSVVHRSDQHLAGLYTTGGFRDGERDRHAELGGEACAAQAATACNVPQPVNADLIQGLELREMPVQPAPQAAPKAAIEAPALRVPTEEEFQHWETGQRRTGLAESRPLPVPSEAEFQTHQAASRGAALNPSLPITFFPRNATDDFLDACHDALKRGDVATCSALAQQHAQLPHMQERQEWGRELYQAELHRQSEEQRGLEEMERQEQQQQQQRSRGRSL